MKKWEDRLPQAVANKLRAIRQVYCTAAQEDEEKWSIFANAFKIHGLAALKKVITDQSEADPMQAQAQAEVKLKRALESRKHLVHGLVDLVNTHTDDAVLGARFRVFVKYMVPQYLSQQEDIDKTIHTHTPDDCEIVVNLAKAAQFGERKDMVVRIAEVMQDSKDTEQSEVGCLIQNSLQASANFKSKKMKDAVSFVAQAGAKHIERIASNWPLMPNIAANWWYKLEGKNYDEVVKTYSISIFNHGGAGNVNRLLCGPGNIGKKWALMVKFLGVFQIW